ncbi:MAG: PIN domain-containing protein [Candidatus Helarchaeales archaeon]
MGCNIGHLFKTHELHFQDMQLSRFAVDGTNIIFKYLTKIRNNGEMLKDGYGRPTSHLFGMLYFIINLLERHVIPIVIFDGPPLEAKRPLSTRKIQRLVNAWKWHYKYAQKGDLVGGSHLFKDNFFTFNYILIETMEFLKTMGIPTCRAPADAEAQCARLVKEGKASHVLSQDHDALLFGSKKVIRNFNFKNNTMEYNDLDETLNRWNITLRQLVDVALLVGTDFNPGIKGIGPVKGLKIIQKHGSIENYLETNDIKLKWNPSEVRNIFLNPITRNFQPLFHHPNPNAVKQFIGNRIGKNRLNKALERLKKAVKNLKIVQTSVNHFLS